MIVCIILIQKLFVRDCILVKSGKRKEDKPYIAKVASIWQESGLRIPQSNHLLYLPYFSLFFLSWTNVDSVLVLQNRRCRQCYGQSVLWGKHACIIHSLNHITALLTYYCTAKAKWLKFISCNYLIMSLLFRIHTP